MPEPLVSIAVDAMGGDHAPTPEVEGALRAARHLPVEVVLVESPEPSAPYGIKGVGEIGLVPTAGAVAAALHDVDGVWRSRLPMRSVDPDQEAVSAS